MFARLELNGEDARLWTSADGETFSERMALTDSSVTAVASVPSALRLKVSTSGVSPGGLVRVDNVLVWSSFVCGR